MNDNDLVDFCLIDDIDPDLKNSFELSQDLVLIGEERKFNTDYIQALLKYVKSMPREEIHREEDIKIWLCQPEVTSDCEISTSDEKVRESLNTGIIACQVILSKLIR